jgi:hypothetical protein
MTGNISRHHLHHRWHAPVSERRVFHRRRFRKRHRGADDDRRGGIRRGISRLQREHGFEGVCVTLIIMKWETSVWRTLNVFTAHRNRLIIRLACQIEYCGASYDIYYRRLRFHVILGRMSRSSLSTAFFMSRPFCSNSIILYMTMVPPHRRPLPFHTPQAPHPIV